MEEVYTSQHPRLAISGWFHVPQEGEAGFSSFDASVEERPLSSLEQLTSTMENKIWSFRDIPEQEDYDFNEDDLNFLSRWINELYLTPDIVERIRETMTNESLLQLPDYLNADVAKSLHQHLTEQDRSPASEGWEVAGPPHKQRFRHTRTAFSPNYNLVELFEHPAFRKWLYHNTGLKASSQRSIARHFRPGSDYTLATEHRSSSPHLEATLSLTPSALKPKPSRNPTGISARAILADRKIGWSTGEFGGYEVYMTPSGDEEADPAVYDSTDGDDGVLVNTNTAWNKLTLVLRDTGVLKFVKYVSRAAWGGRWDVVSEWRVKSEENEAESEDNELIETDEEEEWMGIQS